MAFLIPFWFLELAALGIYFYLILRAMRTYGYHLLFLLLIALVLAVVTLHYAFVAAYVVGWLKVRRWALQRIMCCWTVSLILLLPLLAMGESVALPCLSVLGPLSMGLALWCWRSSERLRQALRELRLNPSPETSRRMAELGPVAVGPLRTVLRGTAREPRFAALAALGQINSRGARRALNDALYDSDPDVRSVAQLWITLATPEPA